MLLIVLSYTVLHYLYYSAFVSTLMAQIFIRLFADVLIDQLQLLLVVLHFLNVGIQHSTFLQCEECQIMARTAWQKLHKQFYRCSLCYVTGLDEICNLNTIISRAWHLNFRTKLVTDNTFLWFLHAASKSFRVSSLKILSFFFNSSLYFSQKCYNK